MKKENVYIIDYEIVSPISIGRLNLHSHLENNTKGEKKIKRFEVEGIPFHLAAEISNDLTPHYSSESNEIKKCALYDRKFELTVTCTQLAKERFSQYTDRVTSMQKGCILGMGTDVIDFEHFEDDIKDFFQKDANPYKELIYKNNLIQDAPNTIWNPYDLHAMYVAETFGLGAFQDSCLTACTSSTQSVALAFQRLQNNTCELIVAGGTDSIINSLAISSFGKLGVIPESDDEVLGTCKVFDQNRNGTLAGEASGLVILVNDSFLQKNPDIKPMAQILSFGNSLDGYKITAPDPEATHIKKAMKQAIDSSGITIGEIDYIQAHGTGTRQNDGMELAAIKEVFGSYASQVHISSTKDRHGHAIAAAGIQELTILLNCMEHSFIPGNMNMNTPIDPEMNLPKENQNKQIHIGMTNNFAFGGVNTFLILKNMLNESTS